jgi:hypothetical protein
LKAIREDLDLTDWMNDAVNSLRIVLTADESIRTGRAVELWVPTARHAVPTGAGVGCRAVAECT